MSQYNQIYRKAGIRNRGDLSSPTTQSTTELQLPKQSVAHFLSYDDVATGPEPQGLLTYRYEGRIVVEHITELVKPKGSPQFNRGHRPDSMKRTYHQRFRKMRPVKDFDRAVRDANTLVLENYGFLNYVYRYQSSLFANFYKWYNIAATFAHTLHDRLQRNVDRQHFISLELPETLVPPKILQRSSVAIDQMNRSDMQAHADLSRILILELWKRLGENYEQSVFSSITWKQLNRVNLVIVESGQYLFVNFGTLVSIFFEESVDEGSDSANGNRAQRGFLRLLLSMMHLRNPDPDQSEQSSTSSDDVPLNDQSDTQDQLSESAIQQDIERVEQIYNAQQKRLKNAIDQTTPNEPYEAVKKRIEQASQKGRLSPKQQRRLEQFLEQSKQMPNPFDGEGTLDDFRQISQQDLEIDESMAQLPRVDGVVDESMYHSNIQAFDRQYIEKIMDKDIANAIMGIQKAGVIIRDIEIDEHQDATDHYREFTVRVQPIDGEASTLRFRLPVVHKDGTFLSKGVQYYMRKQRNDQPIRKISSDSVSLTSYYAKLFVDRSKKAVVDYAGWLQRQIVNAAFDNEDSRVTKIQHVETFTNKVQLPRIYTILAKRIRSIVVEKKYHLYFDYNHRKKEFGDEPVESVEQEGFVFVGQSDQHQLVMDFNNIFYEVHSDGLQSIGTIEELVGLDRSKAPVEIAEFRAYTRNIPLGIALGFYYGLDQLIDLLEVPVRRVPAGQPTQATQDEYVVRFNDESIIFPRSYRIASLIFAGLNRYHRSIKRFPSDSFNRQDVYSNILEENGFRVGFIRELQLTEELFIDPITHDLLEEMGEPTSLTGLMIRCCELLQTDDHPEETDMDAMRIRGYERISGAVYSKLTRAIRSYRARGAGKNNKIEINPEEIWQAVSTSQDPSITQVEDSNPIKSLKEKEVVTFMGSGGRSTQSMVKRTRAFHESDMGVISEATVDSGKVAVNAYTSADPQLANLRGLTNHYDSQTTGNASMLSTSALNAPAAEHDDPKRINTSPLA